MNKIVIDNISNEVENFIVADDDFKIEGKIIVNFPENENINFGDLYIDGEFLKKEIEDNVDVISD